MSPMPRRARDVGYERLDSAVTRIPAPIAGDRIEEPAPCAEVGEHADRALGPGACPFLDQIADRLGERLVRGTVEVRATELDCVRSATRPQRMERADLVDFVEVEKRERDPLREFVANRQEASVKDGAFEDRTVHQRTPSSAQTRSALATPSSWKPYPQ